MGWVSLTTGVVALGSVVYTGARFLHRLDYLARRQEVAEFKAEYKQLEDPEVEADPLLEEFRQLELQIRNRQRLERQATCKHENGVTCMVQFGTMDKVHYCNDCGALTKTHT